MKCECGNSRFRMKNKLAKIYKCRSCGALYQDGEKIGQEDINAVKPSVKDVPVATTTPAETVNAAGFVEPVVEPEVKPRGFFGRIFEALNTPL